MTDIEKLVIMGNQLVATLDQIIANEKKYGADMCYLMEQISFDFMKSTSELREISHYCVGDVA